MFLQPPHFGRCWRVGRHLWPGKRRRGQPPASPARKSGPGSPWDPGGLCQSCPKPEGSQRAGGARELLASPSWDRETQTHRRTGRQGARRDRESCGGGAGLSSSPLQRSAGILSLPPPCRLNLPLGSKLPGQFWGIGGQAAG